MSRVLAAFGLLIWFVVPASAQTAQELGELRLQIQELEERVRQLTGQNEQLLYEVNQLRAELGRPPSQSEPAQTGAVLSRPLPENPSPDAAAVPLGAPPQDLGTLTVSPDDPLVAPDGAGQPPIDLSTLAGGGAGEVIPGAQPIAPGGPPPADPPAAGAEVAALPETPPAAPSGTAREEYDLAYGYILTGDYAIAEESFGKWLERFPDDPQAADARFWLGESHLQQGEFRDAANAFLTVYKSAPESA
jgi:TolA-binding protein